MRHRWLWIICTVLSMFVALQTASSTPLVAQTERGPYARIAVLRPYEGHSVEFEAGYIRHLAWHKQAGDPWIWYGWTVTYGERQRWFVYATFGHSAANFDKSVSPTEDERDNILNIVPHAEFVGNALYEYLPRLSRGTGEPQPATRLEFITVDLVPGAAKAFEAALSASQSSLQGETLWYRMLAGGPTPRYVRLRPLPNIAAIVDGKNEQTFSDDINRLISKATVEILTLRPTMSYGLAPAQK